MTRVGAFLAGRTRRGLLALSGRRTIDLSRLDHVPPRLTWPLQRDGLDVPARLAELREREPVHLLTSFLGLRVWVVTGPGEARSVLADQTAFSNDIRPFVGANGSAADGYRRPRLHRPARAHDACAGCSPRSSRCGGSTGSARLSRGSWRASSTRWPPAVRSWTWSRSSPFPCRST